MTATDEDEIDASKAPLIEHLAELRARLIWSLWGLGACMVLCFVFAKHIFLLNVIEQRKLFDRGTQIIEIAEIGAKLG